MGAGCVVGEILGQKRPCNKEERLLRGAFCFCLAKSRIGGFRVRK